jgi:hypothetical protein
MKRIDTAAIERAADSIAASTQQAAEKITAGAICRVVMRNSRSSCREGVTGAGYCVDFGGFCGHWAESGSD